MPLHEHVANGFRVVFQIVQSPVSGFDGGLHIDMHGARSCVEAHTWIDDWWNVEKHRHDWRFQACRKVKRTFVEPPYFSGGDTPAFGAEVDRFAGFAKDAVGALEDADSFGPSVLRNGKERAHQRGKDAKRDVLSEKAAEKKARVRQTERDEHKQIERRCVVRDENCLRSRERLFLMNHDVDPPKAKNEARHPSDRRGIQASCPEERRRCHRQQDDHARRHHQEARSRKNRNPH